MGAEKVFRTKTGYCHVLPNRIAFTREGVVGSVAEAAAGSSLNTPFAIYSLVALFLLYQAVESYQTHHSFQATLFGLMSGYLFIGIYRSRNNTTVKNIERDRVQEVRYKKATALSRAYFVVYFQDEEDQTRKRLITMPGANAEGQQETDRALAIFAAENLLR